MKNKNGPLFVNIVAGIGAVLIFVGIGWLIAKNWLLIPDLLRVAILVFSTIACFVSGVLLRRYEYGWIGRIFLVLGGLLFMLSVFLISRIYKMPSSMQNYAWLLLLSWSVLLLIAYFLDSKENLVVSLLVFFSWANTQYTNSVQDTGISQGSVTFGIVLILLSGGALLYGLSALHSSIRHKFTNIYRFFAVFYFLSIFYALSFQSIIPRIGEYSLDSGAFSAFLISFVVLCFLGSVLGIVFSMKDPSASFTEVLWFLVVLVALVALVLSTKAGAGILGTCSAKGCSDFKTYNDCISAPDTLSFVCEWSGTYCKPMSCYYFKKEADCNYAPAKLNCAWKNTYCTSEQTSSSAYSSAYKFCSQYNDQKEVCEGHTECKWHSAPYRLTSSSSKLPTSIWLLWILNNAAFLGFIILIIWYGQSIGSTNIVNIGLAAFILEIITRYIGFWMDFKGYLAFSILAIIGGLLLILGALLIPKWRRTVLDKTKPAEEAGEKSNQGTGLA